MKINNHSLKCCTIGLLVCILAQNILAQSIAPEKSAKAAATSDATFIARNIQDNQDDLFLAQKALESGADPRVKEIAQLMLEDHTAILYSFQELNAAGAGSTSSGDPSTIENPAAVEASVLENTLSTLPRSAFDTVWVSGMLKRHQAKFDELSTAMNTVTNPRLTMAIKEAIPKIRKHRDQLNIVQRYLTKLNMKKKKEAPAHK